MSLTTSDSSQNASASGVLVGFSEAWEVLLYERANRHGIIAGATGTGKTITLQVLAESFSKAGISVFAADIKGDLSGISAPAQLNDKLKARASSLGLELVPEAAPCVFWDIFGQKGHPIRATISDLGPLLLARLFDLNPVQEGVLNIVFHLADQQGLALLDLKDLRALLTYVSDNAKAISAQYGQVSASTIGTIQRQVLSLETQGGEAFFGEPALRLEDLLRTDINGHGYVNILSAESLMNNPRLYSTFLLWLLSELFETLPEIGDTPKPRLVFFFDEAHLLFNEAPKALIDKIEQVVRLIRSKGVGIYFITQNPSDIPDTVLSQLGNRIQHALRAYTPTEQKGLKAAANAFRAKPGQDTEAAIQALGVGEALVSFLDEKGSPREAHITKIRPPASRIGPITPQERSEALERSPVRGLYDQALDRPSAFEALQAKHQDQNDVANTKEETKETPRSQSEAPHRQSPLEAMMVSLLRSVGTAVGREIIRGLMGSSRRRR